MPSLNKSTVIKPAAVFQTENGVFESVITVLAQNETVVRRWLVPYSQSFIWLFIGPTASAVSPGYQQQQLSRYASSGLDEDLNLRQVCGCVATPRLQAPLCLTDSSGSGLLRPASSDTQSEGGGNRTVAASTAEARRLGRCSTGAQLAKTSCECPVK